MRTKQATVKVDNKVVGQIEFGLTILVGFQKEDTIKDIDYLVDKVLHLRIFDDENGIPNLSLLEIKGSILSISQFTLLADTKKGRRPSYKKALNTEESSKLYQLWNEKLKEYVPVQTGIFGADMKLETLNDGPMTILMESRG